MKESDAGLQFLTGHSQFSQNMDETSAAVWSEWLWFDLLAVVSMVSYRVWQPARLVVQPVEFRHQAHSNGTPHARVQYRHLHMHNNIISGTN